jgi:hypothetical protein
MLGWHVALGCGVLADHLAGPKHPSEPKVAISVGTADDGPLLVVGGRF